MNQGADIKNLKTIQERKLISCIVFFIFLTIFIFPSQYSYSKNSEEEKMRMVNKQLDQFERIAYSSDSDRSTRTHSLVSLPYEDRSKQSGNTYLGKLAIAWETSFIRYEEPGLMREKGFMQGINVSYIYRTLENKEIYRLKDIFNEENGINMYKIDFKYAWGKVDYDSQGTGSADDIEDRMAEVRAIIGYDIPVQGLRFTPYAGLGLRYLHDDLRGQTSNGAQGYRRESKYFYLPLGIETLMKLPKKFSLSMSLEYDLFLGGKQVTHLNDIPGVGFDRLTNIQDHAYGLKGSLKLIKDNKDFDFYLEPFIRYWHIEDSEVSPITINGQLISVGPGLVYAGIEPENNSTEIGLKMGADF